MDPDPESDITFTETESDIFTPETLKELHTQNIIYFQFSENEGRKNFYCASLLPTTRNIVTSESTFDDNYTLISGSLSIVELSTEEYIAIKRGGEKEDLPMIGEHFKHRRSAKLITSLDEKTGKYNKFMQSEVDGQKKPLNLSTGTFSAFAIENRHLYSLTDQINNYLVYLGTMRGLPTTAFKSIEKFMKQDFIPDNVLPFEMAKTLVKVKKTA